MQLTEPRRRNPTLLTAKPTTAHSPWGEDREELLLSKLPLRLVRQSAYSYISSNYTRSAFILISNFTLESTPQTFDDDDAMAEAPPTSEPGTSERDHDDEDEDMEDAGSAAQNSSPHSEVNTPEAEPEPEPEPEPVPRKKRLGRPPKIKPPGWDAPDDGSEPSHTPAKRGRGRGGGFGRGGGRWARRGGPSHVTQQPIDKEGNLVDVVDDEVALPEDEEGEKKVGKFGHLQGDREYRCRTFTVLGRGERLYMLSTEPARCVGFRDSYLFFNKHKRLYKIIINDEEKRDMIDRELIPHSYKGRAIGIVTARSVFREFGAQIIVGGKRIIDDYEVKKMKEEGATEGELADPSDILPKDGEPYNKNQYVAWHGASSVYHTGAPTVPMAAGKAGALPKRKVMVNDVNWMLEHALEARYVTPVLARLKSPRIVRLRTNDSQPLQHRPRRPPPGKPHRRLRPTHKPDAIPTHHATNPRPLGASPRRR